MVRASDYWSRGPGFDSRLYHGNFQRKIQLSKFYAYPDGSPSQLIRISGVLLYMEVWLHPFFPALDGGGSSDWCPSLFTKGTWAPDRLGGPRASLDHLQKREIFLPCRNSNQDTTVLQPVAWLLYRLCLIILHQLLSGDIATNDEVWSRYTDGLKFYPKRSNFKQSSEQTRHWHSCLLIRITNTLPTYSLCQVAIIKGTNGI